jgi:nucleoside diphosphate kinase
LFVSPPPLVCVRLSCAAMSLKSDILSALEKVTAKDATTTHAWVKPYEAPASDVHQFLFFLKPEATANYAGVKVDALLELTLKTLHDFGVEIGSVRVLSGDYLDKHNLMGQHYGVISAISREGPSVISEQAKKNLDEKFKAELETGAPVLGGHQFLAKEPNFNAFSLCVLNDNLGTVRLAGGTYAMKIKVLGKPVIILNPFHAYQLVPYTTKGHSIVLFEARSTKSWEDLRQKLTGTTDPKEATEGSIRNLFLKKKSELGLGDVDKGTNGVHASAGPLEGMVELQRFFSDHEAGTTLSYEQTAFGKLLISKGLSLEQVQKLAANPDLDQEGKKVSAFDATEEKDSAFSADVLTKAKFV